MSSNHSSISSRAAVSKRAPLPLSLGQLIEYRKPLLLQGPIGPFFAHLAGFLERQGAIVRKINFNAGDRHFYNPRVADDYTDCPQAWLAYFEAYVTQHEIDVVVLFGEWRFYHHEAHVAAARLGIPVFVFEEGYIRPHYVTLEPQGVNGNSSLPVVASDYVDQTVQAIKAQPFNVKYVSVVFMCMTYYLVSWFRRADYQHYRHHRAFNPFKEGLRWLRSWAIKWSSLPRDTRVTQRLLNQRKGNYFLVPLQVKNDSQIARHSRYSDVAEFVEEVVGTFARAAAPSDYLVFKHHPMDRAYTDYRWLIKRLAREHGVATRVVYLHESWLPALLDNAKGVVVVNSTVGLSGLIHKAPVKAMGDAIYNFSGLSDQQSLADFFVEPKRPDPQLVKQFMNKVVVDTQMNMSFYSPNSYALALHERVYSPSVHPVDLAENEHPASA